MTGRHLTSDASPSHRAAYLWGYKQGRSIYACCRPYVCSRNGVIRVGDNGCRPLLGENRGYGTSSVYGLQ